MSSTLVWLRDDLRLVDNPALHAAAEIGDPVTVVYVLDEVSDGIRPLGSASKWWLHHSLQALHNGLHDIGSTLILRRGSAAQIIGELVTELSATTVMWNRRYGKVERDVDAALKTELSGSGITVDSFQANLLFEPWTVRTGNNTPYTVFTPFWKNCVNQQAQPRLPYPAPTQLLSPAKRIPSENLDDWGLLPTKPNWAKGFHDRWSPGETGAHRNLSRFFDDRIQRYAVGRDFPSEEATSELSPHLRFGEISPFTIWHAAEKHRKNHAEDAANITKFLAELGWREFSYHLYYHWPHIDHENFDARFDHFPWLPRDEETLKAWQRGETGVAFVDAGMKELWQTGYMHNRVRMVVGSFLIKNLLQDWRLGEAWFWDTLVDADPANNAASWQWVAGSGADAAPYFRVFNPLLQGAKFDPENTYQEKYLGALDNRPDPIIDLGESRNRALAAFEALGGIERSIRPPTVDF